MSTVAENAFSLGFMRPYHWVLGNAACLFALSRQDQRELGSQFPDQRTRVIPNGVEPNPPADDCRGAVEAETGIPPDRPLVLFVGRIARDKGAGDLLEVVDRIDTDCTFVLVGPDQESTYEDRLASYDDETVQYLGYTDQALLRQLYQRADVFFFPTRTDVFPLVVLEAMAAETPVVSTTVGGIPEQVTQETGVLHEPGDYSAFARSLNSLLRNEDIRAAKGEAALERVRSEFSWDAVSRAVIEEYDHLT